MRPQVLLDPHFRRKEEIFSPDDLARLHQMADIVWGRNKPMPERQWEKVRSEISVVVAADWRYGSVEHFPRLQAILEVSGRFPDPEQLDYSACFMRGIPVLSCAPAFGPAVAEMALALTLAAGRDIVQGDVLLRAGQEHWGWAGNRGTFLLAGQPVGFIGFGGLGRALAPLLKPFHCSLSAYDPGVTDEFLCSQGVTPAALDTLLETSRVIYVLAAPTPANRGLLDRRRLRCIPKGALLVLISRAHLVDFDALTEMVCAGRFRAAIDVFPQEPLPLNHPIRMAPGCVLSAHRAGGDAHGFHAIGHSVVETLSAIFSGRTPCAMLAARPESVVVRV